MPLTPADLAQLPPEDFRVLVRLGSRACPIVPGGPVNDAGDWKSFIVLDTETTGTDPNAAEFVELAMIRFRVDMTTGQVDPNFRTFSALRDPGIPIPPGASAVNGITDEMVAGQSIDPEAVARFVEGAAMVFAHKAEYDRPVVERYWPLFEAVPWGCSLTQMDWAAEGAGSAQLRYVALEHGFFFPPHRALPDCEALLGVLARPLPVSGRPAMLALYERAMQASRRVYAIKSPFETKDLLKARDYTWKDIPGDIKGWFFEVGGADKARYLEELRWLGEVVYGNRPFQVAIEQQDPLVRFSARKPNRATYQIDPSRLPPAAPVASAEPTPRVESEPPRAPVPAGQASLDLPDDDRQAARMKG